MACEQNMAIVFILITALLTSQSLAQSSTPTEPTYFNEVCGSLYGNYTANSSYATNLLTVLTTLYNHSSVSLFYNTSSGSGNGSVHGQYYCRFDADSALCSACVAQAAVAIVTNCTNYKSASIWYDVCSLRYHNQSMFGVLATGRVAYSWSLTNVTDPDSFEVTLNSTLDTVIKKAAFGNDFRRFGVDNVAVSAFDTTYFLVQCSPDLSDVDCDSCLWETYDYINRCCGNWPERARVFFSSCQMRYSNSLFYTAPLSPSPPPQPLSPPPPSVSLASPPPPAATQTPTVGTGSSEKVKAGLAVVFLALLTLQL